jgi:hypothetical protein
MSKRGPEHVMKTLARRRDFLAGRIEAFKREGKEPSSMDVSERAALVWATSIIDAAYEIGTLDELRIVAAMNRRKR